MSQAGSASAGPVPVHDPEFWRGDFWPHLARLRADDPVHRVDTDDGRTYWAVSRHADVLAVSKRPERWRSGRGILVDDQKRHVSGDESVIYLDPPDHARHRKLVSGWFRPRTVAAFEARIRRLAVELLDEVAINGSVVDIHETLAVPLPIQVIAEMLGIPPDDHHRFREWSDLVIAAGSDELNDDTAMGMLNLYEYFGDLLGPRRAAPGDDLLSDLVQAELDGEQLSHDEMLAFCMTLLVAGNETTRNLIGNGLPALAEHPEQWQRLRDDRTLVASAVEELLRWVTPVIHFARTAVGPQPLGDHVVADGEMVMMLYPSANRDESVFGPTADELDITRDPNPHLAFGFGEHFCLGAQLARIEVRVLLEELLVRCERLEPGGPLPRRRSNLMRALDSAPLRLHPA